MTTGERDSQLELLQGTLNLLILQTLAFGPAHGHAIARIIQQRFRRGAAGGARVALPSAAEALRRGVIVADDGLSKNNRKARFYRLTAKGRKRLSAETSKWERFSERDCAVAVSTAGPEFIGPAIRKARTVRWKPGKRAGSV